MAKTEQAERWMAEMHQALQYRQTEQNQEEEWLKQYRIRKEQELQEQFEQLDAVRKVHVPQQGTHPLQSQNQKDAELVSLRHAKLEAEVAAESAHAQQAKLEMMWMRQQHQVAMNQLAPPYVMSAAGAGGDDPGDDRGRPPVFTVTTTMTQTQTRTTTDTTGGIAAIRFWGFT